MNFYETKYTNVMSNHYEKKNQNWKRTFLSGFDTSGKNSQHCFTNSGNLTVKKKPKHYWKHHREY